MCCGSPPVPAFSRCVARVLALSPHARASGGEALQPGRESIVQPCLGVCARIPREEKPPPTDDRGRPRPDGGRTILDAANR